jgi:hypothetical protein
LVIEGIGDRSTAILAVTGTGRMPVLRDHAAVMAALECGSSSYRFPLVLDNAIGGKLARGHGERKGKAVAAATALQSASRRLETRPGLSGGAQWQEARWQQFEKS